MNLRAQSRGQRIAKAAVNMLTVGVGYTHTQSEQQQHDEKGVVTIAIKSDRTKMTFPRISPSSGVEPHAA